MPRSPASPLLRGAVGYEVYVRSFADSTGNGVGDLPGITERLDHLAWLGVDVVWITPFFTSPMADFGYDVADYTDVDPRFGTREDLDELVERAHGLGMTVIADLVPNHTSSQHEWFREARSDPDGPYRDYYLWRDPAPDGGPPNNWLSHFGGSAWTLDHGSGQYYCHLFLPEQPDLNWRNPAVHDEFERVLRHWFDAGIDGFRIDVAQALYKDELLRDAPLLAPLENAISARDRFESLDHRYDLLQPETVDVFRRWREIADEYGALLVGETYVESAEQLAGLVPGDGLHLGFWFRPMRIAWDPTEIRDVLEAPTTLVGAGVGWVLSSHDESRPVARFGGGDRGRRRSIGLSTLLFGLPGMPFLYQGEELGLDDARLDHDQLADPLEVRNDDTPGRDVCRTPIPWEAGPQLGFSTASMTWLPQTYDLDDTVAAQRDDPTSHLQLVRRLVRLRHDLSIDDDTEVSWLCDRDELVGFWRGDLLFVLNVSASTHTVETGVPLDVLFQTDEPQHAAEPTRVDALRLGPDVAIVARRAA